MSTLLKAVGCVATFNLMIYLLARPWIPAMQPMFYESTAVAVVCFLGAIATKKDGDA